MFTEFVDTSEMKVLFESTIRHVPTKSFGAPMVMHLDTMPALINLAAETLVRCLARREAVRHGVDLHAGVLPTEQRVRDIFHTPKFRPHLQEWCALVNDARDVLNFYATGEIDSPGLVASACQSLALLDLRIRTERQTFDPRRLDETVNRELLVLMETLEASPWLTPSERTILTPRLRSTEALGKIRSALYIDGTLIDTRNVVTPKVDRSFLRLLAGKVALAEIKGIGTGKFAPGAIPVDGVALLFLRQNHLLEFGLHELFGAAGWQQYLDGFAEQAGLTRVHEIDAPAMV